MGNGKQEHTEQKHVPACANAALPLIKTSASPPTWLAPLYLIKITHDFFQGETQRKAEWNWQLYISYIKWRMNRSFSCLYKWWGFLSHSFCCCWCCFYLPGFVALFISTSFAHKTHYTHTHNYKHREQVTPAILHDSHFASQDFGLCWQRWNQVCFSPRADNPELTAAAPHLHMLQPKMD